MQLQLVSMRSAGRLERGIEDAGGDVKEPKDAVGGITAQLVTSKGSPLTPYLNDDRAVWKEFRRELVKSGSSTSFCTSTKLDIEAYFEQLGSREILANTSFQGSPGPTEGAPESNDSRPLILPYTLVDHSQRDPPFRQRQTSSA